MQYLARYHGKDVSCVNLSEVSYFVVFLSRQLGRLHCGLSIVYAVWHVSFKCPTETIGRKRHINPHLQNHTVTETKDIATIAKQFQTTSYVCLVITLQQA